MSCASGGADAEVVSAEPWGGSCSERSGTFRGLGKVVLPKEGEEREEHFFDTPSTLDAPNTAAQVNACGWHEGEERYVQILLKVDQKDQRGCKLCGYSRGYSVCC